MTCCSNCGAMMGGYASRLDPAEVGPGADLSDGETEGVTFISSSTSLKTESAEVCIGDDDDDVCLGTASSIPTRSPSPSEVEVSQPTTTVTLTPEQQQVLDYVRAGEVYHTILTSQQCK